MQLSGVKENTKKRSALNLIFPFFPLARVSMETAELKYTIILISERGAQMPLSISKKEYQERQAHFFSNVKSRQVDGVIVFNTTNIFYLTGFFFRPSERPIAFFIDPKQHTHLFVPAMEREHAEEYATVEFIHSYPEYPGLRHPMAYFKEALVDAGFENQRIGLGAKGYSSPKGYVGLEVPEILNAKKFDSIQGVVENIRMIKSDAEIKLVKESCRWGNLAHKLLQKYSTVGVGEIEIGSKATSEATLAMVETLGADYRPNGNPANAFYRGQVGPHSAFPHSNTSNAVLKRKDTLVSQSEADVWGYKSELERTMFVQEVTPEQEKYFHLMVEAQEIGLNHIKPGEPFSNVEEAIQAFFKEQGVQQWVRHHSGHNIGLLDHEPPFFDLGDHTVMKPGMVVTVEPGLYVKNVGGFRHSDTVLITNEGAERLTYYPRDLESLICS